MVAHVEEPDDGEEFAAWAAEASRIAGLHRVVAIEGEVRKNQAARLARAVVPEQPPLVLAVPGVDEAYVIEEVAALIARASGAAVAPREDVAGVVDGAADALRSMNVRSLVLLDADPFLRAGGDAVLGRWSEGSDATVFVIAESVPDSLAPSLAVRATRTDRATMAELEEGEDLDLLLQLSLLPVRVPMRALGWMTARDGVGLGRSLEALRQRGLARYSIAALEIVAEVPAAVRREVLTRHPPSASLRSTWMGRVADGLAEGACKGPKRLSEADFSASHRALTRHLLAWARSTIHPTRASLAVALLDALAPLGSLLTALTIAETALEDANERDTRLALEIRLAQLERSMGRRGRAVARMVAAVEDLDGVSTSGVAEAALALARLSTPEAAEMSATRRRANELIEGLGRADPAWALLSARARMLRCWAEGDAHEALSAGIEAQALSRTDDEIARLDLLGETTANAVGAGAVTLACELATSFEVEGARASRADIVARARGLRGCALVEAGQLVAAIEDLSAAIEQLASSGFRQNERWHRFHRGLAHALHGDVDQALLDFDDFAGLSRMLAAPHELGVLAAAAAGSESARLALSSLRGLHPCFLPMVGFLAGESDHVPELSSVPGFFALEARLLDRLVRAGATGAGLGRERSRLEESRTLVIGKEETWFAYEGREVSLKKMHTLRRVFGGLLAARAKGASLGVDELFSVGWPGERVAASSATNRVYVTMCRLRSLGLKDAIVYGEAGWTIPTSVRVVRARRSQGVA